MSERNDGGPAFPVASEIESKKVDGPDFYVTSTAGMSLRDYFAIRSLPIAYELQRHYGNSKNDQQLAEWSYRLADAMLKEREK